VKSKKQQTAMVLAGVAAVGAAAAWLGRRHLRLVPPPSEVPNIAPPPIEAFLVEGSAAWDVEVPPDTVPAPLSVPAPSSTEDISDLWRAEPELRELNEGDIEGYDAVAPEDLGTVWLSRATQTADDSPRMRVPDEGLVLDLTDGSLSEGSLGEATIDSASPPDAENALDVLEAMERMTERSGTRARHANSKAKKNHGG
jgi:hypothetical protein